jgi:hypothetical protein
LQRINVYGPESCRYRCSNRRCINPGLLKIGSLGETLQDERDFSANGVDFGLL